MAALVGSVLTVPEPARVNLNFSTFHSLSSQTYCPMDNQSLICTEVESISRSINPNDN